MITPSDSPSSPSNYAQVPVQPMDIQAASPVAEVTAAFDTSIAEGGSGVLYPMSPRIAEARELLQSPQGSGGFSVQSGASHGWPTDVMPPDTVDNGGYGGA